MDSLLSTIEGRVRSNFLAFSSSMVVLLNSLFGFENPCLVVCVQNCPPPFSFPSSQTNNNYTRNN